MDNKLKKYLGIEESRWGLIKINNEIELEEIMPLFDRIK